MQKTNLNVAPIYDDFDESKNFHRILFNSGKSVQARELTQAQTILQSQIERLGKHIFTEGSMVVPGGIKAVEAQDYITLTLNSGSLFTDFAGIDNIFLKSSVSGAVFSIAKTFDAVSADPITLFIDFLTPGTNQEKKLALNEAFSIFTYNSDGSQRSLALGTVTGLGKGSWVKVQAGVYFVRGMFVQTTDQEYVVSKFTTDSTVKVGFRVIEEIVTSDADSSLLSNANGYPNYNASGASRLKITLSLTGINVNAVDKDFIEIARFDGGSLSSQVDYTSYSIIEQAIAQRTYETNGDYVVSNFGMDIKEHLNDGTNNGVYTLANGGDSTKLVAAMKPGIAYVKGYRVENIGIQNAAFQKARDTAFLNNAAATIDYGQYLLATNVKSLPDIDIKKQILLLDNANAQIGTARVRAVRKDGSNVRFYIFDTNFNFGKTINLVKSIKYTDASSLFTADLVASAVFNGTQSSLVFPLPVSAVKSLYQSGSGGDTSYTVLRSFNLTTNASGVVSVSVGSNEFFGPIDAVSYFVALAGPASVGTQFDPIASLTLGGTIVGTTLNINLGSANGNQAIKVIAPVLKSQTTQKSKTLLTVTDELITFPETNRQAFTKADIFDLIKVTDKDTGEDITSMFTIDNGQRDGWYELGRLVVADSSFITRNVKATYRYFNHSAGDYFSVDSYSGLIREQIPSYNGVNLSDMIDFRPLKDAAGNFTASTVFGEIIKPADTIRADITYYLPRTDIVVVNSDSEFSVIKGIPSLVPETPDTPSGYLKLYELYIPAYTMKPSDVAVKAIDNKRYTMRDIGKLESRISNLEYYTTLSSLEAATNKTEVLDPVTGNNRFKNGFAVDGFTDYRLADLEYPEWSAAIDFDKQVLNPSFAQGETGMTVSSTSGVVKPNQVFMKAYTEAQVVSQPYATTTININPYAVFSWIGNISLSPDRDYWKDTVYAQPIVINNVFNFRGTAVEGTVWGSWIPTTYDMVGGHSEWYKYQRVSYGYTTTFSQASFSDSTDNLVATQIIPFMRSIWIRYSATGFRPFTRLYPFWDGVFVGNQCIPDGGTWGTPIVTDANGAAYGYYLVPNQDGLRFPVGTSVFRMSDSPANLTQEQDPNNVTTWGSTTFASGGVLDTRQTTTINTTVLWSSTYQNGQVRYIDPIAQTFIVPNKGGCFVTGFDIFFQSKARAIPVTLELRTANSGLPTSTVIGSVTLNPNQVNTSGDGSAATRFNFTDPVYLQDGIEYAIVLIANTQEYNVFIATQGQNIIGSQMALSKQAYMGVFLTSSNSSTWNPQQNTDLKFNVYRAVYNTADSAQVVLDCGAPTAMPLDQNALTSASGSTSVVVKYKSHGLKVGDNFTLAGAVSGNGHTDVGLNGVRTVIAADLDTFTFAAGTTGNAVGAFGGSGMTAIVNMPFNIFVNNVDSWVPDGTAVTWEYRYTAQSSRVKSGWAALAPKTNINVPSEGVIRAAGDLQIRATLTTSLDNISPQIDSSGFDAVLVSPRVDTVSKVFNYVTTDIKFDNPTAHAKFYVGAKLPGNSGMKLYIKLYDTADDDISQDPWTEVVADTPVTNSENFVEYTYTVDGNFIGYKIKIELTGSRDTPPALSDFRTLAYA